MIDWNNQRDERQPTTSGLKINWKFRSSSAQLAKGYGLNKAFLQIANAHEPPDGSRGMPVIP
jgi:hypothetical protein